MTEQGRIEADVAVRFLLDKATGKVLWESETGKN